MPDPTMPATPEKNPADMDERTKHIETLAIALRVETRTGRRRSLGFSALLTAIVCAGVALTFARVRQNFTDTAMDAALTRQAEEFRPLLQAELAEASRELLPVYRTEAGKSLDRIGPEIGNAAVSRLRQLPANLQPAAMRHGEAIVRQVYARLAPDLHDAAGTLPKDREKAILEESIARMNADLAARGNLLAGTQSARLERVLGHFDIPPADATATVEERQRQFLHLVLMLADHHVLYGWEDPGRKPPLAGATAEAEPAPKQFGLATPAR